ncbi:helix-turn-helix domain-containing protein [Kitasatospora sp. NBC_01287]|uniref:transcriptional regulator n=1 Tax=Kitasatospora sp. NBC_01287 TaxID=2903573 RepID=UPI0022548BEE|nr:helix-turn-helix domain-containing protein [Kitasatospora sp. NBC_01287]MCX4750870.1 helix-turn-helix domain-containing protein [Kitasatospora sp. NBC_01287]
MRAVAHPTRLALLEVLARHAPLTATEAAELLGESPTNCAFHLRTLAKYGFVEEAGDAPGRRRPWRLRHLGFRVDHAQGGTEASHASEALARVLWETWLNRAAAVNARRSGFEGPWLQVTSGIENLAYLTPDEARQLHADLRVVLDRYQDRLEDPSRRPAESLPVEMLLFTYPLDAAKPEE